MLIKTIRLFNTEWFRQPFSNLEATLRFPYLIKHGLLLFFKRSGLYWFICGLVIYQLTKSVLLAIPLGFISSVAIEFMVLKKWFNKALRSHLKIIEDVKKKTKQKTSLSNKELIKKIENSTNKLSKGSMNLGYVGFASWGWELLFQALYPRMVKNHQQIPHHLLMIGFKNKTTEMDIALWRVANQNKSLNNFQKTAKEKREIALKQILPNLKIPKNIFLWFLKQTQENSQLREERRFYCFYGDYYIRQLIFELAKRLSISKSKIFTKTWEELKNEIN